MVCRRASRNRDFRARFQPHKSLTQSTTRPSSIVIGSSGKPQRSATPLPAQPQNHRGIRGRSKPQRSAGPLGYPSAAGRALGAKALPRSTVTTKGTIKSWPRLSLLGRSQAQVRTPGKLQDTPGKTTEASRCAKPQRHSAPLAPAKTTEACGCATLASDGQPRRCCCVSRGTAVAERWGDSPGSAPKPEYRRASAGKRFWHRTSGNPSVSHRGPQVRP